MQTFLPYKSFTKSAEVLDWQRLGKQRVEALQIHNVLTGNVSRKCPKCKGKYKGIEVCPTCQCELKKNVGWQHHPAVLMWKGYENALVEYKNIMILEWQKRGYKNSMELIKLTTPITYPPWIGNEELHRSHRSNLLRKDFEYYSKHFKDPDNLPYIWPVIKGED